MLSTQFHKYMFCRFKLRRQSRLHIETDESLRRLQDKEAVDKIIQKYNLEVIVAHRQNVNPFNISHRVVCITLSMLISQLNKSITFTVQFQKVWEEISMWFLNNSLITFHKMPQKYFFKLYELNTNLSKIYKPNPKFGPYSSLIANDNNGKGHSEDLSYVTYAFSWVGLN